MSFPLSGYNHLRPHHSFPSSGDHLCPEPVHRPQVIVPRCRFGPVPDLGSGTPTCMVYGRRDPSPVHFDVGLWEAPQTATVQREGMSHNSESPEDFVSGGIGYRTNVRNQTLSGVGLRFVHHFVRATVDRTSDKVAFSGPPRRWESNHGQTFESRVSGFEPTLQRRHTRTRNPFCGSPRRLDPDLPYR